MTDKTNIIGLQQTIIFNINLPIIFSISLTVKKKVQNNHQYFLKPNVTSSKAKYIKFTIM